MLDGHADDAGAPPHAVAAAIDRIGTAAAIDRSQTTSLSFRKIVRS